MSGNTDLNITSPLPNFSTKTFNQLYRDWIPGLLSDHQIQQLAQERNMIHPFVDHTVRDPQVISYGLSSYTYDATLASEFKILHNNAFTCLDVKSSSQQNLFTHVTHDQPFMLQPHGFALARTREYFKLPPDIMAVCLTKSSYARCFTGDTTVLLQNNVQVRFDQLWEYFQNNPGPITGMAIDDTGQPVPTQLIAPRKIAQQQVWLLTLSDGSTLTVTPDHQFLTKDPLTGIPTLVSANLLTPAHVLFQFSYNTATMLTVSSVAPATVLQDVYCVTAPAHNNFILGNGLAVSNCALIVNPTPLQPGWEGYVTLELHNTSAVNTMIYPHEGICQFMFFKGSTGCLQPYPVDGKYQKQLGVTEARI